MIFQSPRFEQGNIRLPEGVTPEAKPGKIVGGVGERREGPGTHEAESEKETVKPEAPPEPSQAIAEAAQPSQEGKQSQPEIAIKEIIAIGDPEELSRAIGQIFEDNSS